jgi:hypothetical protein
MIKRENVYCKQGHKISMVGPRKKDLRTGYKVVCNSCGGEVTVWQELNETLVDTKMRAESTFKLWH